MNYLHEIYYDPANPAAFSGVQRLHTSLKRKVSKQEIKDWLKNQLTHTLHANKRKNYNRDRYIVDNISEQWQIDLIDLRNLAVENDGINFIVAVIDVFSKFAWLVPIKRKTSEEIIRALNEIFSTTDEKPRFIVGDKGKEFTNLAFQNLLKRHNIQFFSPKNEEIKAAVVERFIRTAKQLIFKYLTSRNTFRYIDVLPKLTYAYNHRYHTSIKMCPAEVNPGNILQVWKNLYSKKIEEKPPKFCVGQHVRVSKSAHIFDKGYLPNFSDEIFVIENVIPRNPTIYKLKDLMGEDIDGSFYENELQEVALNDKTMYRINKILKSRRKNGKKEVLIEWKGWPAKFNSWIPTYIFNENR